MRKTFKGWTYYARLLEFPWVAFYKHRTKKADDNLDEITSKDVLFTIAAHKSFVGKTGWQSIGNRPLEKRLRPPKAQAVWDDAENCQIIDDQGEMRPATPKQCKGLEPAAVWEPNHIADRLDDTFAGRPNKWLANLLPSEDQEHVGA
jgi:hypothetical protein